ncbi:MAG: hypothetical protein LBO62_02760 [Endomicrobium sp.]|jgi:predicted Fe-Mo cluster-binding NifX family protein|nr:hypothetical protein [Endomicrobium sp.]
MAIKIALTSSDGKFIDKHFGKCEKFLIAEFNPKTGEYEIKETREIERLCSDNGHTQAKLLNVIKLLSGCKYVITARIGVWVASELKLNGIIPIEFFGKTKDAFKQMGF